LEHVLTSFELSSFWDDDLKTLSNEVMTVFGAEALDEAMTRATNACRTTLDPDAPLSATVLPRYVTAIKAEFRRLLTPP
jgi:hypothetical protein